MRSKNREQYPWSISDLVLGLLIFFATSEHTSRLEVKYVATKNPADIYNGFSSNVFWKLFWPVPETKSVTDVGGYIWIKRNVCIYIDRYIYIYAYIYMCILVYRYLCTHIYYIYIKHIYNHIDRNIKCIYIYLYTFKFGLTYI